MSTPAMQRSRVPWPVLFVSISLIWGSSFLLMKIGLEAFAPIQITAARILLGGATVAVLALATSTRLPRDRQVWALLQISAFFLVTLPFFLFPLGEERISSAFAGIANSTTPIAAVIFAAIMLPQDRLTPLALGGVAAGFVGVLVISQPWQADGRPDPVGFAITIAASACYGFGWTFVKKYLGDKDLGGLQLPTAQMLSASAQILVVWVGWWLVHRERAAPWSPNPEAVSQGVALLGPIVCLVALGVIGTGIAYNIQFELVRAVGPQVGATITYLIPVVAVVLGVVFLQERLTGWQVLGSLVVLGSAVLIGVAQRPARSEGEIG